MMCEPKNDNVQQDYYNTQGFKGLCSRQIIEYSIYSQISSSH